MKQDVLPDQCQNIFDADLHHKYLFFRRTRIIATLGPASSSPKTIREMILDGLNVVRINFSHGDPEEHLKLIRTVRKVSAGLRMPVAILGDLCGPKIRVGKFRDNSVLLKENSVVTITTASVTGDEKLIPCQYKKIVSDVAVNDQILLDDGNLELKVIKKDRDTVQARVIRGGVLKNNKGMNLPFTKMNIPALTAKDRKDVLYCIKGQVDYIALSFVRSPQDILDLKNLLRRKRADISVIAKIEKPEALQNIQEILSIADGIMIARGDLGVELPAKKVPFIQSKLIEACIRSSKPVIVATQMLESMIEHSRPTRAEVTDVAAACLAGVDAVMLSGETASGKYPLEALRTMDSVLRETEAHQFFTRGGIFRDRVVRTDNLAQNAIGAAISQLSRDLMVRCIVVFDNSDSVAHVVSSDRPAAPILALTSSEKALRRLQLIWGVYPHLVSGKFPPGGSFAFAETVMKKLKLADRGDFMLLVAGPSDNRDRTNTISIYQIA